MAQADLFTKPEKKAPERLLADLVHHCRTCGARCGLSDDAGRTWFCYSHRPEGFFERDRRPARPAPPAPAPVVLPESDEF